MRGTGFWDGINVPHKPKGIDDLRDRELPARRAGAEALKLAEASLERTFRECVKEESPIDQGRAPHNED